MTGFESVVSSRFDVGTFHHRFLSLFGSQITPYAGFSITLSQEFLLKYLDPNFMLTLCVAKAGKTSQKKAMLYGYFIGKILYVGCTSITQILLHSSMDAWRICDLKTHHFLALIYTTVQVQKKVLTFLYRAPDRRLIARQGLGRCWVGPPTARQLVSPMRRDARDTLF